MFLRETASEALRSLWSSKQRTLLALLGIVIGIGSVIAMISIGVIVRNQALQRFKDMGTDIVSLQVIQNSKRERPYLLLDEALAITTHCPDIVNVAPYTSISTEARIMGKKVSASILGVTGNFMELCKLELVAGRALSDLDAMMPYCVISNSIANKLATAGIRNPLGYKLTIHGRLLTVVGVLREASLNIVRPWELNEGVLAPLTTTLNLRKGGDIRSIIAKLAPGANWRDAEKQVKQYVANRTKAGSIDMNSAEELIEAIQEQMQLLTLLLGAVGSISLVVGGVGVMNVMLISVTERKKEIGIRRAIGARKKDIQAQFLVESICLCLTGGLLGIVAGVAASYVAARLNGWEFLISWWAALLGVGVSCLVGVFFGYYPARQAARMNPIDALRDG